MSQNDFVIADASAASVLSDLNSALQALASLSSGSVEPPVKYANMLWYDTGSSILKIRNEANSAWIAVGEVDQGGSKFIPAGAVPSGAVQPFAMSSAPNGWLSCNGANVSRTTYSDLFAAIGTTWGAGDGTTTFGLPDLRGEFVRGWDAGRGADSGRSFASSQADQFQDHGHRLTGRQHAGADGAFNEFGDNQAAEVYSNTTSVGAPVERNSNGTPRVGSETRPRNVAMLYCIKT